MKNEDRIFPATAMPDQDWWQALWPDPLGVLEEVGFVAGMTAVDLCCGDGLFTVPLSDLLDGNVYAVELDPDMLDRAKAAVAKAGVPSCTWVEGDARDLAGLIPEPVDSVLMANTFHGVPDQTALARCVEAILKPGGSFVVINWHVAAREDTPVLGQPRGPSAELRMSPDDVRRVVEPARFHLSAVIDLLPYHYGAVFRKESR